MKNNNNEENHAVMRFPGPVLGFVAFPGTGKSALTVELLALFESQGLRVAVIKQSQDDDDHGSAEPGFGKLLEQLDQENIDLVLVDGFGHLPFARIELYRPSLGNKPMFPHDRSIIAVASDEYLETGGLPLLNIDLPQEVAGYINRWLHNHPQTAKSSAAI